ncbi:MAG TPA: DivIVA domain-containing protein [Actinotalea caeni]|uniref:DivIVA domain-containing protein n=1 Tax=Actinotalea caeni TaxID=1348467 RepID=UPI002B4B6B94|nr:DivIVA domain-containing protein [Actinotalea caeni]HLV57051.1 DivIVA domain-containing protein [Actinotalea caeni]
MALTPEDVVNKRFQPTKFREGYDQDEVDDFLDEVVNTLRALDAENSELKAKLEAAERRLQEAPSAAPAAEQSTQQMPAVAESPVEPEPEPEPQPAPAPAYAAPAPQTAQGEPESATGLIALAQRVHDEYVSNGKAEAERILAEARAEAERVAREAEEQRNRTLGQLEGERSLLERKIDELRVFERDYRTRLKSYLEGLLNDVEGRGSLAGAGTGPESEIHRP